MKTKRVRLKPLKELKEYFYGSGEGELNEGVIMNVGNIYRPFHVLDFGKEFLVVDTPLEPINEDEYQALKPLFQEV